MLLKNLFVMVATMFLATSIFGCSGGDGDPVSPGGKSAGASDKLPAINLTVADDVHDAVGLMGAFDLYLDPSTMTVELMPQRYPAIGEDFIVSALYHWEVIPCGDCLRITGMMPDGDNFKVVFECKHPFPKGDPSKPATGKNRLDLDVFDVALVIAPQSATAEDYSLTGASAYTDICANADGYTTELAICAGDTAAMPYFLVIDDSISGTITDNRLEMGDPYTPFDVYFHDGGMFKLYLTMGYGASAVLATRFTPKFFVLEFNRKAAWKVEVVSPNGDDPPTSTNTWNALITDEEWPVTVKVFDWQIGATVYPTPTDFANAPQDNIYAASDVESVNVEIPGMYDNLKTLTTANSGTGTPTDPLVYTFNIANENGLAGGQYIGLVKVVDERDPQPLTANRDFLVHNDNGALVYYTMPEYATYQTFLADVVQGCGPITGSITSPTCPATGIYDDAMVGFEALASSANGGDPIVLYEWDQDYDGATFDVDATGANVSLGPFDNPTCGTPTERPVTFTVAVRATDSCTPPNTLILGTCDVVVEICVELPIKSIGFLAKDAEDTWFDVAVQPASYVYVVADHPATGNTGGSVVGGGKRTSLRFANDLTTMEVMNSGTGMANPHPGWTQFPSDWDRIDVSISGNLVTNLGHCAICAWTVSGTTATSPNAGYIWCGASGGFSIGPDVTTSNSLTNGQVLLGYGERSDNCPLFDPQEDWTYLFSNADPSSNIGYNVSTTTLYDLINVEVKGIEGLAGTDNVLVFVTGATVGKLAVVGNIYSLAEDMVEIETHGSPGTGDGEFTGGLDVAMDNAGNIVTLENHEPGSFRFQKFNSTYVWQYTSPWIDAGEPMRMDFDVDDNQLYVLSTDGVHIMSVQ